MSTLTINGVELSLDLLDADVLERYQTLNQRITEEIKEPTQYEGLSTPDAMRLQCRIVDRFFDDLFGPGTAQNLFHGGSNLGVHMDTFGQVSQMAADANREFQEIQQRYSPARIGNREQRRAAERQVTPINSQRRRRHR